MRITVRYFAAARELAGVDREDLSLDANDVSEPTLRTHIAGLHPRLGEHLHRMRLALNGDFAPKEAMITDGDEVVWLPPVAGGAPTDAPIPSAAVPLLDVRASELDPQECFSAVAHSRAGAVCTFHGVVRDHADGQPVARLDYEAYRELALRDMQRILEEITGALAETRIAALHRVGSLAVGDLAVVVAASAPHRSEAFEACRQAIDRIKESVPIWKKEWAPDGTAHWVEFD